MLASRRVKDPIPRKLTDRPPQQTSLILINHAFRGAFKTIITYVRRNRELHRKRPSGSVSWFVIVYHPILDMDIYLYIYIMFIHTHKPKYEYVCIHTYTYVICLIPQFINIYIYIRSIYLSIQVSMCLIYLSIYLSIFLFL